MTNLASELPQPPRAKVLPKPITHHGDTRIDNYFWLREKQNPDVAAYLKAENRYTEAVMKPAADLQKQLYEEMVARIKEDDSTVPYRYGGYLYYSRTEKGKQYSLYCRKEGGPQAPEQLLIDGNTLAAGKEYFRVGNYQPSPDHRLLAYSTDFEGDETYTILIKDLKSGRLLKDQIPNTYYGLEWASDNKTFFYITLDNAKRPYRLWRHILGTASSDDKLIYEEKDERFTVNFSKTRDGEFLLLVLGSLVTSEVRYLPASDASGEFRTFAPRKQDLEYEIDHHQGFFYVRINDTGKNFRLVRTPVARPSPENWQEVIPHSATVKLEGIDLFLRHLVVWERDNGLRKLRVRPLPSGAEHYVTLPDPVYSLSSQPNREFDTAVFRFGYTSLITPFSVFDYDMNTRSRDLRKQDEVRGYDASRYSSDRLWATAPDGVKVPISVVYRTDFRKDGNGPLLLQGYGAYGLSRDATFSSNRVSLLDRGFAFAIAHIRGGGDLGDQWRDDGKLLRKRNTFTDFIACAEHLIAQRFTSPSRLAIEGGSAGGLLMGAVVNMRPDLFHAVLAKVPFVDVLNTILDPTLPLTVGEYEEWGNPSEKLFYDYMKSYSPYDNVSRKAYPNMFITAGLNDPRVSYWEPAKWTAKLRAMNTGKSIILLKTNMGAGHFGQSGRYDYLKEIALDYAFLLSMMGRSTRGV
jgi:oligopeptidase B